MRFFSEQIRKIVNAMCIDANTPRALTVKLLLEHDEYHQLFALKTDVSHYLSAEAYFVDVSISDFLRKFELELDGLDLVGDAERLFHSCEGQNALTNARLLRFCHGGPYYGPSDIRVSSILGEARKIAGDILGLLPSELDIRFGPGATFGDRGKLVTLPDKISTRPTITRGARCLLPFWEKTAWCRSRVLDSLASDPLVVRGNRFTTVPKDALKRRGICIEPSINVSFQLSVGKSLKDRLRRYGLDMINGQHYHRFLARQASITGSHATIDLSNASDTVSWSLVKLIIPSLWFDVLDSLRSPFTLIGGKWVKLEKFSSMGNGYTFELETLIFFSICLAISRLRGFSHIPGVDITVYGDDIIVPSEIASDVVSALRFCGLTPNEKKTFLSGPFRESCGGDFFSGKAVRPHQLKEDPNEPAKLFSLANGIRRMVKNHFGDFGSGRLYRRAWRKCLDDLPNHLRRLRGPEIFGDLVIHDENGWSFKETADGRGFIRTLSPDPIVIPWNHWRPSVVLASALYGSDTAGVSPRGHLRGYRIKWTSCLQRQLAN